MQSESDGEVVTRERRRRYDATFKRELVAKTRVAGASVARIAREHGINANQVFKWRRQQLLSEQAERGEGTRTCSAASLVEQEPASEVAAPSVANEGLIEITLGSAQIRIRGAVDRATLDGVLSSLRR